MNGIVDLFSPAAGVPLPGIYNPWLVVLSVAVAIFTSTMALQMVELAERSSRGLRLIALVTGSVALGAGVWTMHFVAMLAFDLCMPVTYNPTVTVLSMAPSLAASACALSQIARARTSLRDLVIGGVLVGGGIGAMHYTGMAAMVMAPQLRYDFWLFALSIVVAVVLAILALWIRFGVRSGLSRLSPKWSLVAAGTVMGLAISGMHYTGMAGARFYGDPSLHGAPGQNETGILALGIAFTTITITLLVVAINVMLRYRAMVNGLTASEARSRAIMGTAIDGIITFAGNGEIRLVNDAVTRIFGWTAAEMTGRNISMLITEEYRSSRDTFARYLNTGEARIVGTAREVTAIRKDGSTFPIRLAIGHAELPDEHSFVAYITDTTDQHRLQQELQDAKTRAERAADARTAFLANMSHEIRTPMNSILGFAEVLMNSAQSADQRKATGIIRNSARSLLRLLNEILDLAKLDRGAVEIVLTPVDLKELAEEVVMTLSSAARSKGLQLGLSYSPGLARCFRADAFRIRQVLGNLLDNAVKFTDSGSVGLAVSEDAGGVHFEVSDTGIGIPADRLERIFDPFIQADASFSRRFGGTGLGTTICKQLVELMKGHIRVESEPGAGSRFHVVLPLQALEGAQAAMGLEETLPALPSLRVLAVDDVVQNVELLQMMLTGLGHHVATVLSGEAALEEAACERFDLILLDIRMPGISGLETATRIRSGQVAGIDPRIPIIALSASVLDADRARALATGIDGFIAKPIERATLVWEIARVLGIDAHRTGAAVAQAAIHATFDHDGALRRWGGNRGVFDTALARFAEQYRDIASDLAKRIADGKPGDAVELAHRGKGVAANLGLAALSESLDAFQHALGLDRGTREAALANVRSCMDDALHAIDVELTTPMRSTEGTAPAHDHGPDADAVARAITALLAAMRRGALDDAAIAYLGQALPEDLFAPVCSALDEFDFPLAESRIQDLVIRLAAQQGSVTHVD
ncbi:MAG TPA: MHYT domain-containing protein [Xanthomonadaceae bacterium]|jgi:PAS domain S-box-containing protein